MRAVLYDSVGGPEVLYLGTAPDPQPASDELLIRVRAAALNRADLLQRRGAYPPPPGASPILGLEVAGEVVHAPEKAPFAIGERVMAVVTGGGYAEYACVSVGMAMRVPEGFTWEQAAAIPEAFLTAHLNLFRLGALQPGERVLIHAGGSGVGTAAIQLAREAGAHVFATAGTPAKLAKCRELGAQLAINYKQEDFAAIVRGATNGRGVDLILDFIGAPYWASNLEALTNGGRLMLIGFLGGSKAPALDLAPILTKSLRVAGTTLRRMPLPQKIALTRAFEAFAMPRFNSGALQPIVDRVFSLSEAAAAHQYMESNQNIGKIILRVD
ncbi:MAG: NADPH:quinone oxidoreductase [Candidatus Thermofonsia Clade 1 bacterium]|jgi:putative PIG3 family NAD(P)H quinone oxidoreductase|uniref:NADPH:quinone oxidoreductase n=1 Tax=Candidatus Thermofonsia Clade 1 bacterium TaxID=2364210 RepID=A0A2M8PC69_9CHLR|nr:MAG: NADPH:quinone oxidoreductase [Candidatus Thermofonsia Clade 1 bacterium]RMF52735.1 MAG: NAD(P)H-quinone oxidoreductase [Chloroflexota bacterium]